MQIIDVNNYGSLEITHKFTEAQWKAFEEMIQIQMFRTAVLFLVIGAIVALVSFYLGRLFRERIENLSISGDSLRRE